jgi:hypothetical protein
MWVWWHVVGGGCVAFVKPFGPVLPRLDVGPRPRRFFCVLRPGPGPGAFHVEIFARQGRAQLNGAKKTLRRASRLIGAVFGGLATASIIYDTYHAPHGANSARALAHPAPPRGARYHRSARPGAVSRRLTLGLVTPCTLARCRLQVRCW